MDEAKQPGIRLVHVFLQEAAFKHRADFLELPAETPPEIDELAVSLETGLTADSAAALVRVRVRTKANKKGVYAFDITMTALLEQEKTSANMPLGDYITMAGWTLIFPFLREAVANITGRGRFGPVWLSPFNLKAHALAEAKNRAGRRRVSKRGTSS